MTERDTELGDPIEGEVPEADPDLPALDEDDLDEEPDGTLEPL